MKPCGNTACVCVEGKKAPDEKLKDQRIKGLVYTNLHTVNAQVMIVYKLTVHQTRQLLMCFTYLHILYHIIVKLVLTFSLTILSL